MLEYVLASLRAIEHIEIIRIGSRVPIFLPQRITDEFCEMIKKYHPLWINIHTNHPKEITPEVSRALEKLAYAGVPLGNQSVLLAGINDSVNIQRELVHKLVRNRVRPYYLYQCDLVEGAGHFRTTVSKGIEIIEGLRGHTSGYAVPTYVVDAPGGGGKIPVMPQYVISQAPGKVVLRNYEGYISTYTEPEDYDPHLIDHLDRQVQQRSEPGQGGVSSLLEGEALAIKPEGFDETHHRSTEPAAFKRQRTDWIADSIGDSANIDVTSTRTDHSTAAITTKDKVKTMRIAVLANLKINAPHWEGMPPDQWDDLDSEKTVNSIIGALESAGHEAQFFEASVLPPFNLIERLTDIQAGHLLQYRRKSFWRRARGANPGGAGNAAHPLYGQSGADAGAGARQADDQAHPRLSRPADAGISGFRARRRANLRRTGGRRRQPALPAVPQAEPRRHEHGRERRKHRHKCRPTARASRADDRALQRADPVRALHSAGAR